MRRSSERGPLAGKHVHHEVSDHTKRVYTLLTF